MSQWFDAMINPPTKDGKYLCIAQGVTGAYWHEVLDYAKNLELVDEFDFAGEKRPGWYAYDGEWGYYECPNVLYWRPLPDLPDALKKEG